MPPGSTPRILPDETWTEPEKWVWEKTCAGELADFNHDNPKELDPKAGVGWGPERLISYSFLETVLFQEPYKTGLPRRGLRISGAWIRENIDLSNARLGAELWLDKCRFEDGLNLSFIRTDDYISIVKSFVSKDIDLHYLESKQAMNLGGTTMGGSLIMYSVSIKKSLDIRNGMECMELDLRNAKIGGELEIKKINVKTKARLDSLSVEGSLSISESCKFDEVDLSNAKIGGKLVLEDVQITNLFDLNGIYVHRDFYFNEKTIFTNVNMTGAEIGGQFIISNTNISEELNANGASIGGDFYISGNSDFKNINLIGAKIDGQLSIEETKVTDLLDMDSLTVASDVLIREKVELNEVNMEGASIGSDLEICGIKIKGKMDMGGMSVGLDMILYCDTPDPASEPSVTEFEEINMRSVKVGGRFQMRNILVKGRLNMDDLSVAQQSEIKDGSKFLEIQMIGATIGAQFDLISIKVEKNLEMQSIRVGQSIFIRNSEFGDRVSIIDSNVDGSLVTSTNNFSHLDLGGTTIRAELQIGEDGISGEERKINNWTGKSSLNLSNVKVGSVSDGGEDSWPEKIDFDGFIFSGLGRGARGDVKNSDINKREDRWYVRWLLKEEPFSSQPYYQLAEILNKMGRSEISNSILYAAKERERSLAYKNGLWWKWLGFSLQNWTIGYGFGARYFRSLIWVIALIIIGVLVIGTIHEGTMRHASMLDKFGFSLDKLIPVIELNDKYKLDFHGWQLLYFYFHKIMGVILSSFVVAGLSGITKE
jgi:hypothetical protein